MRMIVAHAASLRANEFFVRLVDGSPEINWVKSTNFVDIGGPRA